MKRKREFSAIGIAMAVVAILLIQIYGCGNSVDDYVGKVLDEWTLLQERTGKLVEGLTGLQLEGGLERFRMLAGDARQAVGSFSSDITRKILVPENQKSFNRLLIAFLGSYAAYLQGLQDYLDVAMLGTGKPPDIEGLATEARQTLGDYQDTQEYNGAMLDEDVWGLAGALRSTTDQQLEEVTSPAVTPLETTVIPGPEEAVSSWYDFFNQGDGEAMYYLLSPYSPILEEHSVKDFTTRIEDAHASGLQATSEVGGVKALQEDGLDWAVVQVAVEYGEYTGEGGEVVPPVREEFSVELDYVDGRWMMTRMNSSSAIW